MTSSALASGDDAGAAAQSAASTPNELVAAYTARHASPDAATHVVKRAAADAARAPPSRPARDGVPLADAASAGGGADADGDGDGAFRGELDLSQYNLDDDALAALYPSILPFAAQVRHLNLFYNELTTLPRTFGTDFPRLAKLSLGCNPLRTLPVPLPPTLEELDIGYGDTLAQLPDAVFDGVRRLRTVCAGNQRLARLPRSLFRPRVDPASAGGDELPPALERLELYGNCLRDLGTGAGGNDHDDTFGRLTQLRELNIGRNQLRALPPSLAQCARLETLYAYENDLEGVPRALAALPALHEVMFRGNARLARVSPAIERDGARATIEYLASGGGGGGGQ